MKLILSLRMKVTPICQTLKEYSKQHSKKGQIRLAYYFQLSSPIMMTLKNFSYKSSASRKKRLARWYLHSKLILLRDTLMHSDLTRRMKAKETTYLFTGNLKTALSAMTPKRLITSSKSVKCAMRHWLNKILQLWMRVVTAIAKSV